MGSSQIPQHVAIIMDGNGRWAKKRLLPRTAGHAKGAARVKEIIRCADQAGVKALSLYAFSTENWKRPVEEVGALMKLLHEFLLKERQELLDNDVKLQCFGETDRIPEPARSVFLETIELTRNNTGLTLNFCFNYGGRAELVRAARLLAHDVKEGLLSVREINEENFAAKLYSAGLPDPDLLIRSSGELRISNFLLWQLAYAEFYFTDVLWPDFEPKHFSEALEAYAARKRRFGLSDESALAAAARSEDNAP